MDIWHHNQQVLGCSGLLLLSPPPYEYTDGGRGEFGEINFNIKTFYSLSKSLCSFIIVESVTLEGQF